MKSLKNFFLEDSEEVKGILLAKELLPFGFSSNYDFNLEKVMRPVNFIPESKKLDSLLEEFRKKRYHMAIVVDEYGSVSGLVTIEDILEEIVGEIEDETDIDEEKQILQVSDNEYLVPALTELEDFNDQFNTEFIDTSLILFLTKPIKFLSIFLLGIYKIVIF